MSSSQKTTDKQRLTSQINSNQQMIAIFDLEAFKKEWANGNNVRTAQLNRENSAFKYRDDTKTGIGHSVDALSVAKFTKMATDMGMNGQVILKTYDNKPYVIFKSTGNLRHFVTQLKERLSKSKHIIVKPEVVQMAIGNAQALKGAVRGGMITFALFTTVNIMDYIIRDQATFSRLAGTIATDFAKISVGVLAGYVGHAIGTAILPSVFSSAAVLSLGPIGFAIFAGIGIGFLLNRIDNRFKLTEKIVKSLDKFFSDGENMVYEIKRALNYIEQNPIQAFGRMFGSPVGSF